MNRKAVPVFVALGLMFILIFGFFGSRILERYIPTNEKADITQLLGATDKKVALFLNEELQQ